MINNNFSSITIKYTIQYKSYSKYNSEDKYEMTKMKNQRSYTRTCTTFDHHDID